MSTAAADLKAQEAYGPDIAVPPSGEGLLVEKDIEPAVKEVLKDAPASILPEESTRVLRRLDAFLLPMLSVVVLMQFLDKQSLNYADLLGIREELNITGSQYSWLGSIFYLGYLVASPVHGWFFQHYDLSRYTCINILLWGTVLLCHSATTNFGEIATARFFLGVFEGAITPSFILLTGRFYNRREQIPRTALWFSMNGWAQILGGLIAYGLLSRNGSNPSGVDLWQELFLILGAVTFAMGLVFFLVMPSSPATAKILKPEDRKIAVERVRENKTGINDPHFKWSQVAEAFKDPRLYLFALTVICGNIVNGCITFASAIIQGFGFSDRRTALLGMTTGAAEIVAIGLGVWIAWLTKTRLWPGIMSQMVAIMGAALMIGLPESNNVGRMAGYAVLYFYPVVSPFIYSWLSSCVGGATKKIVFNVVVQLAYCAGNCIGPQVFREKDAPAYVPAKIVMMIMLALVSCWVSIVGALHTYWNRQRDRKQEFGQDEPENIEFSDLTDKQIRSFRYPL